MVQYVACLNGVVKQEDCLKEHTDLKKMHSKHLEDALIFPEKWSVECQAFNGHS